MKTLKEIVEEKGLLWVEREKEKARRNYDRVDGFKKGAYINSFVRRAYVSEQRSA